MLLGFAFFDLTHDVADIPNGANFTMCVVRLTGGPKLSLKVLEIAVVFGGIC